jgi:SWI/SNF-related matrix-associated actin-dependent regulator of chromatin subfamily A-like protein 1
MREIVVVKSKEDILQNKKIFIISYDIAKKLVILDCLYNGPVKFNVVICDECHNLNNRFSERSYRLTPLISRAKRVIMISGTPAINKPLELFNTLHCIRPDLFND